MVQHSEYLKITSAFVSVFKYSKDAFHLQRGQISDVEDLVSSYCEESFTSLLFTSVTIKFDLLTVNVKNTNLLPLSRLG